MNERTSKVITALRYPLAVLVILCHSSFFIQPAGVLADGWESWTFLVRMQLFFCEVLPHVAVPLFIMFSGMLFFRGGVPDARTYGAQLRKRCRTLLVPYLIWSTIAFAVMACQGDVSCTFIHWLQGLWDTELWNNGGVFAMDLPGYPVNMPLWFIRDLLVLVVLSYPIGKLLKLTRGRLLLLMAIWWFPGHNKLFGFGADVLFFYSLGAWISIKGIDLTATLRKVRIPSYIFAVVMIVVESIIRFKLYDQTGTIGFKWIPFNIFVVALMAATLNLTDSLVGKGRMERAVSLARCSFFLFAAHYVALPYLQRALYGVLLPGTQAGNALFFWAFYLGYIALLTALALLLRRLLPKTMSFLTGGR